MNNLSWPHIIAIIVLILLAILRYADKVSEVNFMQIFLLILGGIGSVSIYAYGYLKGKGS